MKYMIVLFGLVLMSSSVFAANDCSKTALELAKMNLDSKAKAYSFSESDLVEGSLKQVSTAQDGAVVYTVGGDIYKAQYSIEVKLDSECGVQSVNITEIGL